MIGHTKEPWRVTPDGHIASEGFVPIRTPFREDAFKDGPNRSDHNDELLLANARRIVACVNACAGIPTEDLERYYNDGGGIDAAMQEAALSAHVAAVKQRDHLLAAVKRAREILRGDRDSLVECETDPSTGELSALAAEAAREYNYVLSDIDAAIATVEGRP